MTEKRAIIGQALRELVDAARGRGETTRIGLMAGGSEVGPDAPLLAAKAAMDADGSLNVVGIGPRPANAPAGMEWLETPDCEKDMAEAMEKALREKSIAGAVALHYPFPQGVATIGRIFTPAAGKPMLIASSTGTAAANRAQAMLHNAVLGLATARSLGIVEPTLGVLNLDAAATVLRALQRMREKGYPLRFGASVRADGGSLLRGNDLLAGAVDVCVCDTLTGNVLMKLFSAANSGGAYETLGWGYGPSVGRNWPHVVSIISRASGIPVIANALAYTARVARGGIQAKVAGEYALAGKAGLAAELEGMGPRESRSESVSAPAREPVDAELSGVDVLDMDAAVQTLWKEGIYAESAMGCTGPVVRMASANKDRAAEALRRAGYL